MAAPAVNTSAYAAADTYTDVSGLAALKHGAAASDPKALRAVAQQFEAMFTNMMLKSMRDTVGKDPLLGSDQQDLFQGMYDQQLSLQMSKGKGLGLADSLIQQLQRMGVKGAAEAATSTDTAASPPASAQATGAIRAAATANPASSTHSTTGASAAAQANFISSLLPQAQAAGQQLGVDPRNLIAQAALETNWGQNLPTGSNNLFGIKATGGWTGAASNATTTEYRDGLATRADATFRAYDSTTASLQDYVSLLSNNPRYAGALNTGSDTRAFATALQRGGYATDPDYVRKVSAVAAQVSTHIGSRTTGLSSNRDAGLKTPSTVPINDPSPMRQDRV